MRVRAATGLAVTDVGLTSVSELRTLHGYVLEPALRAHVPVVVQSRDRLTQLAPQDFIDPEFGYPYTLQRAIHAATQLYRGPHEEAPPAAVPPARGELDDEQRRAVVAHDGVVQVIAPAGSGKTTVLIERVRELLQRGVPATRILCTTFNRDAKLELDGRLAKEGLGSVDARTFHSLGLSMLTEERLARRNGMRSLSMGQWKRLCAIAARDEGVWVEVADARTAISQIKLGMLCTPAEFRPRASEFPDGRVVGRIYELYEQQLAELDSNDFDDQIMLAVRALRDNPDIRERWQGRFWHVLVDEYQDIEPAQELLVRMLAAPEDGFFCVGDEDQTLYGWRRASVRRMIDLDLAYPGLERVSLAHNYRCPPEIVAASRQLIEHNKIRFPKPIHPAPGRVLGGQGTLELVELSSQAALAAQVAQRLTDRARGEIVVLARTTNLLRTVALACVGPNVLISAPEAVFEPRGARQALEAYLRLCGNPSNAQPEDVAQACRTPSRGLPFESEDQVARLLCDGFSFSQSFAGISASAHQRPKLDDAGRILDALANIRDAEKFIRYLRTAGGLDAFYADHEDAFGDVEQVELETLEQAQQEATGMTVAAYAQLLSDRADALRAIRDDTYGIELTTIHRAKGRQWPHVELFACEENQLPHSHAVNAPVEETAAGEGIEAERRLAYVAFTRAQKALTISTSEGVPSRFLTEAGLAPKRPYQPPPPPRSLTTEPSRSVSSAGQRPSPVVRRRGPARAAEANGPVARGLALAEKVGLAYALRNAPDKQTALDVAVWAIENGAVGPETTSERMTASEFLDALEDLSIEQRKVVLREAGISNERILISRLDIGGRKRLVRALRSV